MSAPRPVVLAFMKHYLPGFRFGGPVRTLANMVEALGDEVDFRIVTTDRDMLDREPYPGIAAGTWMPVGKASVQYVPRSRQTPCEWRRLIRETRPELIYLNSLFDIRFTTMAVLAARRAAATARILIAPRGELSPGALAIKPVRKRAFLALAKRLGLYRSVWWHASTPEEAASIAGEFQAAPRILTAIDLPAPAGALPEQTLAVRGSRGDGDPLHIVFLSRISRMKNLALALSILARSPVPVRFDIWGTLEDERYWETCRTLIAAMPEHVQVRYRGVAAPDEVSAILARYDLMFLPTAGENYGHVIAEALMAGTPVLVSDRTPWRDLERDGLGWDLPIDQGPEPMLAALSAALARRDREGPAWFAHVRSQATTRIHDPETLAANRTIFAVARR